MKKLKLKQLKRLTLIGCTAISSALIFSFSSKAQEFFENTGFGVRGASIFNEIPFFQTKYSGECPGESRIKTQTGWFKEENTLPQKNRRVRIYNQTLGRVTNQVPYTDRDYNNSGGTERIDFRLGNEHSNRYFIVREGLNDFKYIIYDGPFEQQNIVSQGMFSAEISFETEEVERNIEWDKKPNFYCLNPVTGEEHGVRDSSCKYLSYWKTYSITGEHGVSKPTRELVNDYVMMVRLKGKCAGKTVYKKPTRVKGNI